MDNKALSPYFLTAINDYRIEYDAEMHRMAKHSLYPSRLSSIYAFSDMNTCHQVSMKYGWPLNSVKKFRLKENPFNRVIKVNMEHVSLARLAYKISMITNVSCIWESYWSGIGNIMLELPEAGGGRKRYESGVIWEYLIEGCVEHSDRKKGA